MTIACHVQNLRLKFPGVESLQFRDLQLQVNKGEKVLLLGPSGCGKSTLLQVLSGLIPYAIEVPMKCDSIVLPQQWAFVFQDPDTQFCMPYVDEELAFVLENQQVPREEMQERMQQLLQRVSLHFEDPHTPIAECSQGMKQRLAIASALSLEPEVLFLDEPTALLDPEGTKHIWQTIKESAADKTLIVVEHKIEHILDLIERVVLFNSAGEIMADGAKDDIFKLYHEELQQYGIWYPGVWEQYTGSEVYHRMLEVRENEYTLSHEFKPIIDLDKLQGFRGKQVKIQVGQAKVYPGEWIVVAGDNGAGKSTLLLSLMQLISTVGNYLLNGQPIQSFKGRITEHVAYVFQNPEFQFVTNSVYEELAHTLRLQQMNQTLMERNVFEAAKHFELESHLQKHPYQCSIGQKRRLSVASAMMKAQSVLLLDEPTFGQDARNTFAILEKLEAWRLGGTAIIMVTHDTSIIRNFATRLWHVKEGLLIEDIAPRQYIEVTKDMAWEEDAVCN